MEHGKYPIYAQIQMAALRWKLSMEKNSVFIAAMPSYFNLLAEIACVKKDSLRLTTHASKFAETVKFTRASAMTEISSMEMAAHLSAPSKLASTAQTMG